MSSPKLTPEELNHFLKERLERLLEAGERPALIGSFVSPYFGDGEVCLCNNCGRSLIIRPWMFEAMKKYNLQLYCVICVALYMSSPEAITCQIRKALDAAERKKYGSMYG